MGGTAYTAIISTSRSPLAANAIDSVNAAAAGRKIRGKSMFPMIVARARVESSAVITVAITSWNGTTAQATLSPGSPPGRLSTSATSARYTPRERERVGQPLEELPRAAAVADPHVGGAQ